MNEGIAYIELDVGTRLLLQVDTFMGHFSTDGQIVHMGAHSFRVRCTNPVPAGDMEPNQEVKITPADQAGTVPNTTRFVRVAKDQPDVVILRLPSEGWRRNRRAFFRGAISAPLTIFHGDGIRVHGKTVNLSGGGLMFETDAVLKAREEVQIIIELKGEDSIGCRGRIAWVQHDGESGRYGLRFIDLHKRDQNRICKMVLVKEFEERRSEIRELTGRSGNR